MSSADSWGVCMRGWCVPMKEYWPPMEQQLSLLRQYAELHLTIVPSTIYVPSEGSLARWRRALLYTPYIQVLNRIPTSDAVPTASANMLFVKGGRLIKGSMDRPDVFMEYPAVPVLELSADEKKRGHTNYADLSATWNWALTEWQTRVRSGEDPRAVMVMTTIGSGISDQTFRLYYDFAARQFCMRSVDLLLHTDIDDVSVLLRRNYLHALRIRAMEQRLRGMTRQMLPCYEYPVKSRRKLRKRESDSSGYDSDANSDTHGRNHDVRNRTQRRRCEHRKSSKAVVLYQDHSDVAGSVAHWLRTSRQQLDPSELISVIQRSVGSPASLLQDGTTAHPIFLQICGDVVLKYALDDGQEASMSLQAHHASEFVVRYHLLAVREGWSVLVMPLVSARRVEPHERATFACQLWSLLADLHSSNLVWTDVRLANALWDGRLHAIDFGHAFVGDCSRGPCETLTALQLLPERGCRSCKSDVWAAGRLLLHVFEQLCDETNAPQTADSTDAFAQLCQQTQVADPSVRSIAVWMKVQAERLLETYSTQYRL
eukprot:TRINITY_DN2841_c0_g3_i1.p1 TRINITY_DN2841_c0_g3~~TRINITY_DN2841_c0_g3_i1.p1  ORF type:complete len:542 (-),score=49.84 TRINITY_DN2841_c0_g3_i1:388-2013(-)